MYVGARKNSLLQSQKQEKQKLEVLAHDVANCRACPRLVEWREEVAREKRASFREDVYWGRGVSGFGDPNAQLLVLGLAPAAHGANRTGRVFTGDRSGDWLYRALHRAGCANQPTSLHAGDGLQLMNAWVTAAVKCAPPGNAPTPVERATCKPFFEREVDALENAHVLVCLGAFAYQAAAELLSMRRRPKFGHGVELQHGKWTVLCSFHPSQQNTFTGKLTEPMFDAVFLRAKELCL